MIPIKTFQEIQIMRRAGEVGAKALKAAVNSVGPGITTREIDLVAEKVILENGAEAGFKKIPGYDFTTCININEGIVHGMPNNYGIEEGDLVTIDLGAYIDGYHSDLAVTVEVPSANGMTREKKFLEAGKKALDNAISACVEGNRVGDVANAMQSIIEVSGYSVSRDLVGHGIGKELHEEPQIPCYGKKGKGPVIVSGMVFAIEVIYQKGSPSIMINEDGWTLQTSDISLAALFEHTVAVTKDGPEVLTA